MKERVVLSVQACHEAFYQHARVEDTILYIRAYAPKGWDGLRDPLRQWDGPSWEDCVKNQDPRAFQHLLSQWFTRQGWLASVLAFSVPACHIGTLGHQAWYRVSSAVAGLTLLKENYVFSS